MITLKEAKGLHFLIITLILFEKKYFFNYFKLNNDIFFTTHEFSLCKYIKKW